MNTKMTLPLCLEFTLLGAHTQVMSDIKLKSVFVAVLCLHYAQGQSSMLYNAAFVFNFSFNIIHTQINNSAKTPRRNTDLHLQHFQSKNLQPCS